MYKGKYRGEDVCVKRLRVARSGSEQAEKGDLVIITVKHSAISDDHNRSFYRRF